MVLSAPLDAAFTDSADGRRLTLGDVLSGRPALLMPVDYACRNVCDPMLAVAGTALAATGLAPGTDYRLVTLGFNPRADAATARAMVAEQLGQGPLLASAAVLTGSPGPVEAVTQAVGYAYVNRTHLLPGRTCYLLPCLGRIETDQQASGPQAVTMEDSFSRIYGSRGRATPAAETLLSTI